MCRRASPALQEAPRTGTVSSCSGGATRAPVARRATEAGTRGASENDEDDRARVSTINERALQTEFAEPGMVVGPPTLRPVVEPVALGDAQVVDAGQSPAHQAVVVELPVLVAVGAEPVAGVVVPLVGEPDGDAVPGEHPQLLDEPVIQFAGPLAGEEVLDRRPAGKELRPVAPLGVL